MIRKSRKLRWRLVPALLALALMLVQLLSGCRIGQVADHGGSGSETTDNSLVGRVAYADGTPAAEAGIVLRPTGYLADLPDQGEPVYRPDGRTDRNGRYRLDSLRPGRYCLEIRDGKGSSILDTFDLPASGAGVAAPLLTLRSSGFLTGRLGLPAGRRSPGFVRIEGLERATRADSSGVFHFRDLPMGSHRFRFESTTPGWGFAAPVPVVIAAGDSLDLGTVPAISLDAEDFAAWPASRPIRIHAAPLGLSGSVADFPVLVRLDERNFNFTEALPDGRDLRFSDSTGRHLAMEIDYWNAADRRAGIWVNLPAIAAGDVAQTFRMHWGNRNAALPAFNQGVFSSASGFAAVWHLDGTLQDASGNGNIGTNAGSLPEDALIGDGRAFSKARKDSVVFRHTPSLDLGAFTVSLWIKTRSVAPVQGLLGTRFGGDHTFDLKLLPGLAHADIGDGKVWLDSLADAPLAFVQNNWSHIAYAVTPTGYRIFLDGKVAREGSFAGAPLFMQAGASVNLGNSFDGTDQEHLDGVLDEVRISGRARSADWIRLEYENQREGSTLLEFP